LRPERTRFANTGRGYTNVGISGEAMLDESREARVLKRPPPSNGDCLRREICLGPIRKSSADLHVGTVVVRTDGAASQKDHEPQDHETTGPQDHGPLTTDL